MKKLLMVFLLVIIFQEAKGSVVDQFYIKDISKGVTGSLVGFLTGIPLSVIVNGNSSFILSSTTAFGALLGSFFNFDDGKIDIPKKEKKKYDFMNIDFNYFCDSKVKTKCIFMRKLIFVEIRY